MYWRDTDTTKRKCDSTSCPALWTSPVSRSFLASATSSGCVSIGNRLTALM